MTPGIYHVKFVSQIGHGDGLAVFKDGTINGGDHGFLYLGNYTVEQTAVVARLRIKQWQQGITSVFGPYSNFQLELRGSVSPDASRFTASGSVANEPRARITIEGRRLSDAA